MIRTCRRRKSREAVLVADGKEEEHERTQVARPLEALPRKLEAPHSQCAVADGFPLGFRLQLRYRPRNLNSSIEVIELQ